MRAPQRIEVVDWFRLLWNLVQQGQTLTSIEEATGIEEATLRGLREGSQPAHWRGERLVGLWCEVMDKPACDVPRVEIPRMNRVEQVRNLVRTNQSTLAALAQTQFEWVKTSPIPQKQEAVAIGVEKQAVPQDISYRVGIARVDGSLRPFVASGSDEERRASRASNFVRWADEQHTVSVVQAEAAAVKRLEEAWRA